MKLLRFYGTQQRNYASSSTQPIGVRTESYVYIMSRPFLAKKGRFVFNKIKF